MFAQARQQGFSLVELMVALVVMGVAVGYALPSYQRMSADADLRSTTMNLVAAVNEARVQSLALQTTATLKATDNSSWTNGWTLTYTAPGGGATTTQNWKPASTKNTVTVAGGTTSINFQANGFINTTARVFTVCDSRPGTKGRKLTLQKNGKVDNEIISCP